MVTSDLDSWADQIVTRPRSTTTVGGKSERCWRCTFSHRHVLSLSLSLSLRLRRRNHNNTTHTQQQQQRAVLNLWTLPVTAAHRSQRSGKYIALSFPRVTNTVWASFISNIYWEISTPNIYQHIYWKLHWTLALMWVETRRKLNCFN